MADRRDPLRPDRRTGASYGEARNRLFLALGLADRSPAMARLRRMNLGPARIRGTECALSAN
ncbi:hypothetical protein ACIBI8_39030 [Streptomyces sp. NPDC050529]|uniref:hypothetical protein n=1 Tax=Streptomyces sp. NPDC050529 TaxID=3365624 RepID=UPI0037ADECBD